VRQPEHKHLTWILVFIACGWVVIAMLLHGCGPSVVACESPDQSGVNRYVVNGVLSTDRRSTVFVGGLGYCTGTVVGPHTVLTAAHCENLDRVCLNFNTDCWAVAESIEHPLAVKPGAHDLRILYTEEGLPGPFATIGNLEDCEYYIVQGWGIGSNRELHEREINVCRAQHGILWASEGSCNGDSGGPLYCNDNIVGVVSFGYGEPGVCDGTGGYVNLNASDHAAWIEENVR